VSPYNYAATNLAPGSIGLYFTCHLTLQVLEAAQFKSIVQAVTIYGAA